MPKKGFSNEGFDINRIAPNRHRRPVNDELIVELKEKLKQLPHLTFKYKECDKKFKWRNNKSTLSSINIDLPIIYDTEEYEDIDYSCIVIQKKTNNILAVFIYETEDPNINEVVKNGHILAEQMEKYLKLKKGTFYSGFGSKQIEGQKKQEKIERIKSYGGKNWLEGLQRYLDPPTGRNVVCFYPRKIEANDDDDFISNIIWLYCGLYELEKRHCPAVADFRLNLAKPHFMGLFPPVPIELNPSTCVGGSLDFSNVPHEDSSISGTTETIIWRPKPNSKIPYKFRNCVAKKDFLINKPCMIYQVGTDLHHTLPTGDHGGVGFVNLSKRNLLGKTEFMEKWTQNWYDYFATC